MYLQREREKKMKGTENSKENYLQREHMKGTVFTGTKR